MSLYYEGLSGDSSSENCSSSEDEPEGCNNNMRGNVGWDTTNDKHSHLDEKEDEEDMWSRTILHLDIDCFYCQCEEIDRKLREVKPPRPLAIGQKHIVVTCNYEARKYGVTKLQLRENAMRVCPDLWIVEGSDLQNYRRHSRDVYESFRRAVDKICKETTEQQKEQKQQLTYEENDGDDDDEFEDVSATTNHFSNTIPVRMGTMDEMTADLTQVIETLVHTRDCNNYFNSSNSNDKINPSLHIFGDQSTANKVSPIVITEDQTGQASVVEFNQEKQAYSVVPPSRRNVHEFHGTEIDKRNCMKRMQVAYDLAVRICRHIFDETKFHTSVGISVSPLLAKLASGLRKPKTANILYPWRSGHLMYPMPLRKMPDVGYRTMKILEEEMKKSSGYDGGGGGGKPVRTVQDVLQLPKGSIVKCLQRIQGYHRSSELQCDLLLQRCRGLDKSNVIDDNGELPKTLSVEDSFRRGTIRSLSAIWFQLDKLFIRLPKLLNDRTRRAAAADI